MSALCEADLAQIHTGEDLRLNTGRCGRSDKEVLMSTFVLVHGACHGAWCWYKVIPLLTRLGHKAVALDLPGHGVDKTAIKEVTLDGYAERVCSVIDEQEEPVVLVGHSMGGGIVTAAAELRPKKIATLVFLSAAMVENGATLFDKPRQSDESIAFSHLVMSPDGDSFTLRKETLRETLYHDCPEEDAVLAELLLVPQALRPMETPIRTSRQNFGRIPRIYIECLRDRVHALSFQRELHAAIPCGKVLTIDTGHSPFFAAPAELTALLTSLPECN